MMLTKNFLDTEFTCHCGCKKMEIDAAFVARLQELRNAYGKPMVITSGYRCPEYNAKIGATKSYHCKGIAADIACSDHADRYKLLKYALEYGFTGIGVSSKFIHLDIRSEKSVIWLY